MASINSYYALADDSVQLYRLCVLEKAIRLESHGLKRRGPSALSIVKREFGFRGNREAVRTQLCEKIEELKGRV